MKGENTITLLPSSDLEIPKEIWDAAVLIGKFMTMRGVKRWELGDICSRNHADDLRVIARVFGSVKE